MEIQNLNLLAQKTVFKVMRLSAIREKMYGGEENGAQDEVPESLKIKKWEKEQKQMGSIQRRLKGDH